MPVSAKLAGNGELPEQFNILFDISVINLDKASDISLNLTPEQIESMHRIDNRLILKLINGEQIIIENFFAFEDESHLYLQGENFSDTIFLVELPANPEQGQLFPAYYPVDTTAEDHDDNALLFWALGSLALAGAGAGLANSGDDGNNDNSGTDNSDNTAPNSPIINPTNGSIITGTAEPNSLINLDVNGDGVSDFTVQTDANGNWSINVDPGLTDGTVVTATATDAAGNVSDPSSATVDALAPAAPVINPTNGTVITGTAEAGSTVELDINGDGTPDYSVQADANGDWSIDVDPDLADGTEVTATATDAAGNVSDPSSAIVDALAPAAPVINPTNGTVITGTAEAGSTVELDVNGDGTPDYSVQADTNGDWSIDVDPDLADGTEVTATATDAVGNVSDPSTAIVDAAAPNQPTIGSVIDDVAPAIGTLSSGDSSNDDTPTLSGTAEAGSIVTIFDGTDAIGTTTADAAGDWNFTPTTPLADGDHSFTVTATDAAGNTSIPSAAFDLTIDSTAPNAPLLANLTVTDDVAPVITSLSSGDSTNDSQPEFSGVGATPGNTITLYDTDGTTILGSATVAGDGTWSITPSAALAEGAHNFTLTATDPAGNESAGTAFILTIDTTDPAQPTISSANDNVGPILGTLNDGDSTNDTTPTLSGTAEVGSTVTISSGAVVLGSTTADASGNWTFTPTVALTENTHSFTVTATDAAGNVSLDSNPFSLTIDITSPNTGDGSNSINFDDGGDELLNATEAANVTLSGLLESGATINSITITDGVTTLTVASGDISVVAGVVNVAAQDLSSLSDGLLTVTMNVTDSAGNTGTVIDTTTLDTQLDTDGDGNIATIDSITDDTGAPADFVTTDNQLLIDGTIDLDDGNTLSVTINGTTYTTADAELTVDGAGNWTLDLTALPALADGTYTVTATVTDTASNSRDFNQDIVIASGVDGDGDGETATIDSITVDSGTAGDFITNDTTLLINGTVDLGDGNTMTVTFNGTTYTTAGPELTVDGAGNWTLDVTGTTLTDGTYPVTVTLDNGAGATLDITQNIVVDTTPPSTGDGNNSITINDGGDGLLNATEATGVTLSGQLENGATINSISITDGASTIIVAAGAITVDGDGVVSVSGQDVSGLNDGTLTVTMNITDAAGNIGSVIDTTVLDTTPPAAPPLANLTVTDDIGPVTGTLNSGDTTDDTQPTFSGTGGTPGETITLYDGAAVIGTASVDGSGNWSITPGTELSEGAHNFTLTATDAAGNEGPGTAFSLTVDTNAPAQPAITGISDNVDPVQGALSDGDTTNDPTPTLIGTAEANSTVTLFDATLGVLGTTTADGTGNWTFTPSTSLDNGNYSFTVTSTDAAGNVSPTSTAFALTINTVTAQDDAFTVTEDSSNNTFDVLANDSDADGDPLTVTEAIAANGTVTINPDGTLNYTPDADFTGTDTIVYYVSDGNGGVDSASVTVTVDPVDDDPQVAITDGALLGLVEGSALGINLGDQALQAADADGDLRQVVITYSALLMVNPPELAVSQALADELGLVIAFSNSNRTLTITASGGGNIDNLAINELLAAVYLTNDLSADLLPTVTIEATDSRGATATDSNSDLLGATALSTVEPTPNIIEGTSGDDTGASSLNGTSADERLYGYDGDDTLNGGDGDDLLRGGSGTNTLNGDAGNDLLISTGTGDTLNGGAGNDIMMIADTSFTSIDGGAGDDILALTGSGIDLDFVGAVVDSNTVDNIEEIDLSGTGNNTLTLDESTVINLTDADNQIRISGDAGDSVTLTGATNTGNTFTDPTTGNEYVEYSVGSSTVWVEPDVTVVEN